MADIEYYLKKWQDQLNPSRDWGETDGEQPEPVCEGYEAKLRELVHRPRQWGGLDVAGRKAEPGWLVWDMPGKTVYSTGRYCFEALGNAFERE